MAFSHSEIIAWLIQNPGKFNAQDFMDTNDYKDSANFYVCSFYLAHRKDLIYKRWKRFHRMEGSKW
jgi:hypothetical protein